MADKNLPSHKKHVVSFIAKQFLYRLNIAENMVEEYPDDIQWIGFEDKLWEVHKFGGTRCVSSVCGLGTVGARLLDLTITK